jgi:hypothetical protein
MRTAAFRRTTGILVLCISLLAAVAAAVGVFSSGGPGPWEHISVRGETVRIFGRGIYRHMSEDVAPQGIAQDAVTLFLAVPMLLWGFKKAGSGLVRWKLFLAGTLMYFLVTYTFYLAMGAYNALFPVYVLLAGAGSFAFGLSLSALSFEEVRGGYSGERIHKGAGGFLIFSSCSVIALWLGVIVPPLLDGSVIPESVEHYTTLIVQGFDLAFLLPLSLVAAVQLFRRTPFGLLLGTVYLVFLSFMMTALTAKVLAMAFLGQNVFPVIFLIPAMNAATLWCAWKLLGAFRVQDSLRTE